jgi:hypothetical protein
VALAVAVSATAGIQLLKGGTFHSTFKVPIVHHERDRLTNRVRNRHPYLGFG